MVSEKANKTVYVVHCIDAEGPFFESREATFERLYEHFGIRIDPTSENFSALLSGSLDLQSTNTEAVAKVFNPSTLNYINSWGELKKTVDTITDPKFRIGFPDSHGNGWIYNWFCVDHTNYVKNPRRRPELYHEVFDFFNDYVNKQQKGKDLIQFHFHPRPLNNEANFSGTHWFANSTELYQILARRLIDRRWFPSVNRPGFHVTRPDSHWFLEQFIPFDYANQSLVQCEDDTTTDQAKARFGDWRRAPRSWVPYHPSHDDYQMEGACKRWIIRCLNIGTRHSILTQNDVDSAFEEASSEQPTILSFCNHDFRPMEEDIALVHSYLTKAQKKYVDVEFVYANAVDAIRLAMGVQPDPDFELSFEILKHPTYTEIIVGTLGRSFGIQPFLAVKKKNNEYFGDNMIINEPGRKWSYLLDVHTCPIEDLDSIGFAANDSSGRTSVLIWDCLKNQVIKNILN